MARMIPAILPARGPSLGEREVFRRLRADPQTQDWVVLHSLDLSRHPRQVAGEADFVTIIPGMGILCIEVKACSQLRREHGLWYYGTESHGDPRGPFKQAAEAGHSIRRTLARHNFATIVVWSAVIFPYVEFTARSEEWHAWQVIDAKRFHSRPIAELLKEVLERARLHLARTPSAHWFDPTSAEPAPAQCDTIAAILRPDFEYHETRRTRADHVRIELKQYTEEQFAALDAMASNPRVAFVGPAGTGKTFLAIEAARRGAAAGRKVLFLCFNRLLGKWLEDQVASLQPLVTCQTLHKYMLEITGVPPRNSEAFWEIELPELALQKLLEHGTEEQLYDELIIDEAQDLLYEPYLDVLDLSLKGGLAAGSWRLFGDFQNQSIYTRSSVGTLNDFLRARGSHAPVYQLQINCRNTPRIAEHAELFSWSRPGYARCLRADNHVRPEFLYYDADPHQEELLCEVLGRLYNSGFRGHDIVVLSTRADALAVAGNCRVQPWRDRLRPIASAREHNIPFTTIHAFKGLESIAAVITDVDLMDGERTQELLYVGLTRALEHVVILAHTRARAGLLECLKNTATV